jgi:glyceraldehyde 3-phosphate dehydrogenase-like protein
VVGDLGQVVLPQIGEMRFSYYCVPTPIGSLAELNGQTDRPVSVDEVNRAVAEAAAGPMRRVLAYDPDPTVSIDVKSNPASCLFDPSGTQTTANGGIKVRGWFDTEWNFANGCSTSPGWSAGRRGRSRGGGGGLGSGSSRRTCRRPVLCGRCRPGKLPRCVIGHGSAERQGLFHRSKVINGGVVALWTMELRTGTDRRRSRAEPGLTGVTGRVPRRSCSIYGGGQRWATDSTNWWTAGTRSGLSWRSGRPF